MAGLGEECLGTNSLRDLDSLATALGLSFPTVTLVGSWVLGSLGLPKRDSYNSWPACSSTSLPSDSLTNPQVPPLHRQCPVPP